MFQLNKALRVLPWVVLLGVYGAPLAAQQFEPTANLYFSMVAGSAGPLPQVLPVEPADGNNFYFTAAASTTSGGNWLAVTGSTGSRLPDSLIVSINNTVASTLAAGSYGGQVVVTSGSVKETVKVTLTVVASGSPSFANLPGGLSFASPSGGSASPQVIQVNNAGAGTLSWTLGTSTFNASNFLTVSATSGTAPSFVTVGVAAANLPGGGTTAGVFIGQLVFTSSAGSVTIPVTVSVGVLSFVQSAPLSFSMPAGGAAPLPQVVPCASTTSSDFYFDGTVYTASGGNWLSVSTNGARFATPDSSQVILNQAVVSTLPAGVYTGEVVIASYYTGYATPLIIPVTLTISPAGVPFFDSVPGGMNFFLQANGGNPGSQTLQIRNAGSGALNWSAVTSTADGGSWLSVSQTSGTAPSLVTVQIASQYLPGGAAAGTYGGTILFESAGSSVSVPITVSVGDLAFLPVSPLSAVMPFHGSAPVVQVAGVGSTTSSNFYFTSDVYTAVGGNWLTSSAVSARFETPDAIEIGFNESVASMLPAGSYTGEVVVLSYYTGYAVSMTIPVTLTVAPASEAFFNDFPGGLQFSLAANGGNPGSQVVQVGNAGAGTLNWTVTASTADGGNWLTVTPSSGTAPGQVTVGVVSQNLPGGAAAGTYNGSLLFESASGTATVPITVSVGVLGFAQVNPLSFNMPAGGSVPLPQAIAVSSITSSDFYFSASVSTSTGGNWLTAPTAGRLETPEGLSATINQSVAQQLPPGVYTGEVLLTPYYTGYATPTAVPVTLTVSPTGAPLFDDMPGGLQFALQANGGNPANQVFQIRNAGSGTLNWTAIATTADGGNWLTISSSSGTAPSFVSVGVLSAKLPGGGAAGTYSGTLLFESGTETVTVPITVSVGVTGYAQVNPISFTMPLHGGAPLPQVVPLISLTGSNFYFTLSAASATGGNWLTVSPTTARFETTQYFTVSVNQAVVSGLAAGTYTAELIATPYYDGYTAEALTIPVTLTIAPPSEPFFDNLPGGLYFSAQTSGGNPASQTISIRNEGTVGVLNWSAIPSTSDGGNWLTVSAASGTAPSLLTIGVLAQNLPGQGATEGTYNGQILLQSATGSVTIPVSVNIGSGAFVQANGLVFNLPGGSNSQTLNVVEIGGGGPDLTATSYTGNGGNWLSISPNGSTSAPGTFTFTVNTSGLTPGVYTGEALFLPTDGTAAQTVQVTLNFGPPPASITPSGGTPQSAVVGTAFGSQLVATLKDASSNPVAGVTVTFTAPSSGASGTFAGGVSTAVTNAQGQAVSPVFTANGSAGSYLVTATGAGLTTGYSLTNLPRLVLIALTPANPSIAPSATQQFTAIGTYSDGSTQNLTASAMWASATTTVATINASGLATGVGAGTSNITASLNGITSPADVLTVSSPSMSSATYVGPDTATQGTWTGVYGNDGKIIANDLNSPPSYATVSLSGDTAYTWAASTTDVRALQTASGSSTRIASTYYSSSSFTINVNLTDGNMHRIALYLLDWDTSTRAETIAISDAVSNKVLSTQTFSSFHNGEYATWNVQGHVLIQVTKTGGSNGVTSAIFFDPPATQTLAAASYSGLDTATQGTWTNKYGSNGEIIANGLNSPPAYAAVSVTGDTAYTWAASTSDVRALQTASGASTRIASTYYSASTFTINVNLTDGNMHRLALYLLDWDGNSRAESISILDANTNAVLSTQTFSSFHSGEYAVWSVKGHVLIQVTKTGGTNAVVSGLFFDPVPAATFGSLDTTTQGTWTGKYGVNGEQIANGVTNLPAFATVSLAGDTAYTWAASTSDVRALQTASGSSTRIASAYYSAGSFTINLNLADGNAHSVALYLLDWDGSSRSETITVLDAVSNAVLGTETFSNFHNGEYAVWNLQGHVLLQVTKTGGANGVVSGLFF